MITDKELNAICAAPRPTVSNGLDSHHFMFYFERGGKVEPSWKYMDKKRMREIFERAQKCGWFNARHAELIKNALKQMG